MKTTAAQTASIGVSRSERRLYLIFALSGFAALVYQIVWQRALFTIYGINVEAVTVVVTAFMLGLGIGSIVGGFLATWLKGRRCQLFAWVEGGIGVFGLLSIPLFGWVGRETLDWSPLLTALMTFALVLVPTLLMGASLPILSAELVGRRGNVGYSVGSLYFVNTLGSALAAVVAAIFMLGFLGQFGAVLAAAILNILVAVVAFFGIDEAGDQA